MNSDLNKIYFELYRICLEKATFNYEIEKDVLDTLDKLKKEVEIYEPPFLVSNLIHCSKCGKEIKRKNRIKIATCFECKRANQKKNNLLYSARSKRAENRRLKTK